VACCTAVQHATSTHTLLKTDT